MRMESSTPSAVELAIGVFDGVHRGHQYLIEQMVASAANSAHATACMTFDPDPETVLHPERVTDALSTPAERSDLLRSLGVQQVDVLPFTREVARQSPMEFMNWLQQQFRLHALWVGSDFALGRDRTGTVATLREIGRNLGFELMAVEPLEVEGRPISSTWIRELLHAGKVRAASELLGRPYCIPGSVVEGARRGQQLGFPTANIVPPGGRAMPADGVYLVRVDIGGTWFAGVANLGGRPTFQEADRLLEVHILDFGDDLYGASLEVCFVETLREVRRFASVEELRAQIERDVQLARSLATTDRR